MFLWHICSLAIIESLQIIMNLLDQLYQYSLRADPQSISISALEHNDHLSISSNATSLFGLPQSSALASLPNSREHLKRIDCLLGLGQTMHDSYERKDFYGKISHYRKISGLLEMLSNKIRKTYYEFIVKLQNSSEWKLTIKNSKEVPSPPCLPNSHYLIQIKPTSPELIRIANSKVHFTLESSLAQCKAFAQTVSCKLGIIHPQRRQFENPDLYNTINVFLPRNHTSKHNFSALANNYQQKMQDAAKALQTKQFFVLQSRSDIVSKSELQRRSILTTFAGEVSQIEDHQAFKAFDQYQQELSQQLPFQQHHIHHVDKYDCTDKSPLFSFEEQQEELKNYISYRRSIDKRRNSTLKEIEKSKQTIKKIVYELQKSKGKPQKQKIRLNAKKSSLHDKPQDKQASLVNSKPCSPSRQQSSSTKQRFNSAKRQHCNESTAVSSRPRANSSSHKKEQQHAETPSFCNNLQVYSNYIKAKKCMNTPQNPSAKKQPCRTTRQPQAEKRSSRKKAQDNLLNISKEPLQGGKRIDLKIDFTKSCKGRAQVEGEKPKGRKNHK